MPSNRCSSVQMLSAAIKVSTIVTHQITDARGRVIPGLVAIIVMADHLVGQIGMARHALVNRGDE